MNKSISYNTTLPTFGDHRPLWPIFGEYFFLPPQRLLHNLEVQICNVQIGNVLFNFFKTS